MRKLSIFNERYYHYDGGADSIACDFHSVDAGLNEIEDRNLRLGFVDEEYTVLLNAAADLSCMLYRFIEEISLSFPPKVLFGDERDTGIYWFNAAVSLYNGTDMEALAENEEKRIKEECNEKSIRLRAVNGLSKEQHLLLITKTFEIVFRYISLKSELDVLIGVDDELARLHSFKKKDGNTELPKSAWM